MHTPGAIFSVTVMHGGDIWHSKKSSCMLATVGSFIKTPSKSNVLYI